MPEPLRLVQVGAGAMGRTWLRTLAANGDVRLVGLADLDLATARRAADEEGYAGLPVAASLGELIARERPDAVVNVTVPVAHHAVSTEALLSGLPVLSEKPLAESVSQGLAMVAAAEVGGQLLMVSQSRRYWRPLSALRTQVERLGAVGFVTCSFFKAPHFGGFRDEMAYPLLLHMAIHQFDLARDLIGGDPVSVSCQSFNPSWSWYAGDAAAQVEFEFAGGTRFVFTGSWCSPGVETSWNGSWRVSAAGGAAVWDGDHEPVAETAAGEPITAEPVEVPEQIAGSLAEFVVALRTGTTPWGEAHSNVLSLAMVEGAIRSAETGRRVVIADLLEEAMVDALAAERRPEVRAAMAGWSSVRETVRHPGTSRSAAAGGPQEVSGAEKAY